MATIVAQANGNWSNPATWAGGVVPGAGDIAQTGNYAVTVDVSVTCTLNPTGSGRFDVNIGGITITGDVIMQSSHNNGGLRATHSSGTVTLTGTATGGAGSYAYGAYNAGAGTLTVGTATGGAGSYAYGAFNNAAGTLNVGTATGGAGGSAHGAYNAGAGTLTVGTATGGAASYAYGAFNNAAGTLNVGTATGGAASNACGAFNNAAGTLNVGTATGGAGGSAHGALNNGAAGTLNVDLAVGNNWGVGGSGAYAYGVYGSGVAGQTTTVKRLQSGPYGAPAIGGAVLMVSDASNSCQMRTAYGGATRTITALATPDFPAVSDVRAGVEFDDGDKIGTAHIPAAGSVALGIPVDATTGTAVLTAAAVTAGVWDAARSGHAGAGTFGATDEWAGSVDEAAIAAAVWDAALSGHAGTGSTGAALAAAGAAGDPWSTALPGAYGAGTAGKLLSDIEAVAPDNKPTVAATGEASANVTHHAGVAVAAADANGNVPVDVKLWKGSAPSDLVSGAVVVDQQGVRDAMAMARSLTVMPAVGSIDTQLRNDAPTLNWYARRTEPGALATVFDANAVDVSNGTAISHQAGNPSHFTAWAMQEFDGSLFAGVSGAPMDVAGGIIVRVDPDMSVHFEYNLAEEGSGSFAVDPTGQYLVMTGIDERINTLVGSIYVRDLAGVWTRKHTLTQMGTHVISCVFVGSRLFVGGAGTWRMAYSDDLGDTWTYLGYNTRNRVYGMAQRDGVLYAFASNDPGYDIIRSNDGGATWSVLLTNNTEAYSDYIGVWRNLVLVAQGTNKIVTLSPNNDATTYPLPFASTRRLIVIGDDVYCMEGRQGTDTWDTHVWHSADLVSWRRVWSGAPQSLDNNARSHARIFGAWNNELTIATSNTEAAIYVRAARLADAASQQQRDAMKLAPSAGAPAAGSVDAHLDAVALEATAQAILEDTGTTLPALLTSTLASFVNTYSTDATTAGSITRRRGDSWAIVPAALGVLTGFTSLWLTIKRSHDDADSASVLHVKKNASGLLDGLLYLNGAASTSNLASITVTDALTGVISIAVDEAATKELAPGEYYYDVQALISGDVATPDSGTFTVTADVTRSVV